MAGVMLWGWDDTNKVWVKVLVDSTGRLIIDPTAILENPPTNGETAKAPQSDWAYDHWKAPDAHHVAFVAADHTAIGNAAPHHAEAHTLASHSTKAHSELTGVGTDDHHAQKHASQHLSGGNDLLGWTDEKLLKGAGAGVAPEEIDVPSGGYTQGARVYDDAVQSIPSEVWTKRAFPHERWDTDTIHDNVTNNTRLTCVTAGKYLIIGQGSMDMPAGYILQLSLLLNNTTYIAVSSAAIGAAFAPNFTISTIYSLAIGDYVELLMAHNLGVSTNDTVGAEFAPEFMMQRIG